MLMVLRENGPAECIRMPIALPSWFSEIAPIVTVVGVVVAAVSLVNTRGQARTAFEDKLAEEYRQITREPPTAALSGEVPTEEEMREHLPAQPLSCGSRSGRRSRLCKRSTSRRRGSRTVTPIRLPWIGR